MEDRPDIVLPRRSLRQPSPSVVSGGDCGACCIAGLLGISVEDAYEMQDPDCRPSSAKDKPVPFGWENMSHSLEWRSGGKIDAVLSNVPFWPDTIHEANTFFGFPGWNASIPWMKYVRMGLQAGYYGLCQIVFQGGGPLALNNHWVMVCGARQFSEPNPRVPGAWDIHDQLLVSCSAKCPEGYWLNHMDMLRTYGGYNIILARPSSRS